MILEIATFTIQPADAAAFEAAFPRAEPIISSIPGYISHELRRSIETPGRYVLLVRWESVEAHTVNFRESPKFQEWRAVVGPFFALPPHVEHGAPVTPARV